MDGMNWDADEDELAWQAELGIPQPHDAVIQKYFQGRDALINQEERQRSGSCTWR